MTKELERVMGTRKFSSITVLVLFAGVGLQLVALRLKAVVSFAPGPYGVLFGLLLWYALYIPPISTNLYFSQKFYAACAGSFLLVVSLRNGSWSALTGLLGGIISLCPPFRSFRIPRFICRACKTLLITTTPPVRPQAANQGQP